MDEEIIKPSTREELGFIVQAAFAPFTIAHRMYEGQRIGLAVAQTLDRDTYVKTRRQQVQRSKAGF